MIKKITLLALVLMGTPAFAQIINSVPYILTVDELKQWTPTGSTASTVMIATTPLAPRFTNTATQFNPALSDDMKIAYLPDGMNNFGNYHSEQNQFNLYNFTHWAYIDKLVWFGGTASQSVQLPSAPWVNAAHKNGVKVFGNVFFAPTAFGGSTATLTNFLETDLNGNFVAIPKMIAIMQYYQFDGWFINQETATNSATAQLMYAFVRNLTAEAEAVGKEIMWYDAMTLTGSVGWQNRLNATSSQFFQRDQNADLTDGYETRVSSNIFINFGWGSNAFPTASRTRANLIGRSQFDVFTGADIWPGRNQGNFETNGNAFMTFLHETATTPFTSLGLFAPNCVYNNSVYTNFNNDPTDYASFYNAENHLFSGDDNNPATVDATGFKGLCNWVPEASVIDSNRFSTNFCTGHGTRKFSGGDTVDINSWHDMNQQDILPTWQWAFSENGTLTAAYDFNFAYAGGNSLKVSGNLPANHPVDLMLYKTKLSNGTNPLYIDIYYRRPDTPTAMKLLVVFADDLNQKYEFQIITVMGSTNGWNLGRITTPSSFSGREIAMLGFRFYSAFEIPDYAINIGRINIQDAPLATTDYTKDNAFVTVSYPPYSGGVAFNINWPDASQLQYTLYDLQGKAVQSQSIDINGTTTHTLDTTGLASGTYMVRFTDHKNKVETKKINVR